MLTLHGAALTTPPTLAPLDGSVRPGELLAIVGPNGAGKSTLLSLLSGFRACQAGAIRLDGRDLAQWPVYALASRRAMVAQQEPPGFDWRVEELIALGSDPDPALVTQLLDQMDLLDLSDRSILTLSGGERQRVLIARGVCQLLSRRSHAATDGGLLLLDEPTSALDIGQQQRLMRQLRHWAHQHAMAIVCVLHDLNLASLYADRVWLIDNGARAAHGTPAQVLTPERLTSVYGAELQILSNATGTAPLFALVP